MSLTTRSVHRLARIVLVTALVGSLVAAPLSASAITREEVLDRASEWTDKKVPYSQSRWYQGYRTDCSGFVSMAWGLDRSLTTWTLPEVAKPISKSDLKPGDVLLHRTPGSRRHVVMFGGWADKAKTRYIGYEHNGPVGYAIRRVIPYPFFFDKSEYKPYRFTGISDGPVVRTEGYIQPVRGADRYITAVKASGKAFRSGTVDTVVIASGENSIDPLVASSLAGAVEGPLLLAKRDSVHGEVLGEIRRLGAEEVLIVGSPRSVDNHVKIALERLGVRVHRIAGPDRYTTSAKVVRETVRRLEADKGKDWDGTVMVASSANSFDALSATPLASKKAWPLLLTHPGRLSSETRNVLTSVGINRAVALGGRDTLSSRVDREIREATGAEVERVGGSDRYTTSVNIAKYARSQGLGVEKAALIPADAGPDAIAAGVAQGAEDSVVLVTRTDELPLPVQRELESNGQEIGVARVVGNSVERAVRERIAQSIGAPLVDRKE